MPSDPGKGLQAPKSFAKLATLTPAGEKDCASTAAAAYDAEEEELMTKSRKIIAASKKAVRDAEAILKRR